MRKITILTCVLLSTMSFGQFNGSTIKNANPKLNGKTKKGPPENTSAMPDLGEFVLTIDNNEANYSGFYAKLTLAEAQASTTNSSIIGSGLGMGYFNSAGFNFYAGAYSRYGDGLLKGRPLASMYARTDELGSIYKTKPEAAFECSGAYVFSVWSSMKRMERTVVSKRSGDSVYIWTKELEVLKTFSIGPAFGFEKGVKEYKMHGKSGLMLTPVGDNHRSYFEPFVSPYYFQSTVQRFTNLKFGAMVQISDYMEVDAQQHGKINYTNTIRVSAQMLYALENSFDNVYGSTFYGNNGTDFVFPGQLGDTYILDEYAVDNSLNKKRKLGLEIAFEYTELSTGFRIYGRVNPGFTNLPSMDFGGSLFFYFGKFKRKLAKN